MITRIWLLLLFPVLILIGIVALLRYLIDILAYERGIFNLAHAIRVAVSFDQLANVTIDGHEDETISSRAYKAQVRGKLWGRVLCWCLDKIDKDHCKRCAEFDRGHSIREGSGM